MNSYRLNGMAGHLTRQAIIKGLNITSTELYKTVKSIDNNGIIILHDGRKFKLELKKYLDENK
jgi:predicted transcriptional regulator